MKLQSRNDRRTDGSALFLFGIVYLTALAMVVAPHSFRTVVASDAAAASALFPVSKGEP